MIKKIFFIAFLLSSVFIFSQGNSSDTTLTFSNKQKNQTHWTKEKSSVNQIEKTTDFGEFKVPNNIHIPICQGKEGPKSYKGHEIEHYQGFSLCYREDYEQSEWVAYKLTKDDLVKKVNRSNKFYDDYNISTKSATHGDYRGSGYDRGHLVPAGDMVRSYQTMQECFRMSNICPQHPKFNQGIWVKTEEMVRNWVHWYGYVYVITGPILELPAKKYKYIGYNKVAVPEYFYKILLSPKLKNGKQIGWNSFALIMENRNLSGKLNEYEVSIDEIEKRTNLDFFSLFDDSIENEIESRNSTKK